MSPIAAHSNASNKCPLIATFATPLHATASDTSRAPESDAFRRCALFFLVVPFAENTPTNKLSQME